MTAPIVTRLGDSYFVVWKEAQIILEYSRFAEHRDTLTAELNVSHELHGALHWSKLNIASASGRTAVVKALEEVQPGVPWRVVLDQSCQTVARQLRTLEPTQAVTGRSPSMNRWLVDQWIPRDETTVLFGDGDTGKSLLVLAIAVAGLQGHRLGPWHVGDIKSVLYLDWESTLQTHSERIWQLTNHREPLPEGAIFYRSMTRPLTDVLPMIRADVDRHKTDFLICDSLGAASGPEPETGDAAIRTMTALNSLTATRAVIAHVSKAGTDQRVPKPYGSVYVYNLARSVVAVRRDDDGDAVDLRLSLFQTKNNLGKKARPTGMAFSFSGVNGNGPIDITGIDPDLAHASLSTQILDVLRQGSQTATAIAEEIGQSTSTVRSVLGRLEKRDSVVRLVAVKGGKGKKSEWGLRDGNRDDVPF